VTTSRPAHAPRPRHQEPTETVLGLRAGLAVFHRRPGEIVRVAHGPAARRDAGELLRWVAAHRLPCDALTDEQLTRAAGSTHHEGLCLTVHPRRWTPPGSLADVLVRTGGAAVALDRVRNSYNIGAILRSAAFFGLDAALLGAPAPHPALSPDAVRVAEGGAEHLLLSRTTDLADTLGRLRARGVRVVGAESDAPTDALGYPFARPTVLVLGHEREGLSVRVRAQCDALVAIRGAGAVGSLNVGVAAGLLVAEIVRGVPRAQ
jgi:RNA methyltransferase, TrmH family